MLPHAFSAGDAAAPPRGPRRPSPRRPFPSSAAASRTALERAAAAASRPQGPSRAGLPGLSAAGRATARVVRGAGKRDLRSAPGVAGPSWPAALRATRGRRHGRTAGVSTARTATLYYSTQERYSAGPAIQTTPAKAICQLFIRWLGRRRNCYDREIGAFRLETYGTHTCASCQKPITHTSRGVNQFPRSVAEFPPHVYTTQFTDSQNGIAFFCPNSLLPPRQGGNSSFASRIARDALCIKPQLSVLHLAQLPADGSHISVETVHLPFAFDVQQGHYFNILCESAQSNQWAYTLV